MAMKYIELNPVRSRLCRKAWRYNWSSAVLHVYESARSGVLNLSRWYDMISAVQWRKELEEGLSDSELGRLRLNTHTGRPLGSDSFLSKLESFLGRRVRPLPVGRPKKCKKAKRKRK
jgi:putative transposase